MIKFINSKSSSSAWLQVTQFTNAPYISPGAQSAGMTRYNTSTQNLEVYDGNAWQTLSGSSEIGLSDEAVRTLEWARKKMAEELTLEQMMEKHPGLKESWERFEIMKRLCIENEEKG